MFCTRLWLLSFVTLLPAVVLHGSGERSLKTAAFYTPPFYLKPGEVANKFFINVPFPKGHIALKSFNAEVVDENLNPVPLSETYLHHWLVMRYFGRKGAVTPGEVDYRELNTPNLIMERNGGVCKGTLNQYFGLGSENRGTVTWVPDPYGIEIGNPRHVPEGFEDVWMFNVHAIDLRGTDDVVGCLECRCHLYNSTVDGDGRPFPKDYVGGLFCCHDKKRCRLKEGYSGLITRKYYMKYVVTWEEWHESLVPVTIYIFDVAGFDGPHEPKGVVTSTCLVEYDIQECSAQAKAKGSCADVRRTRLVLPRGGDVVYGVAHQHYGGRGAALFGQDGRLLCNSLPIYGQGKEAGNEKDYLVGMSTCYPGKGAARVADGEVLTVESNYSSSQFHTGVMGLFYFLVAEPQPQHKALPTLGSPISWRLELPKNTWAYVFACGVLVAIVGFIFSLRRDGEEAYKPLTSH